MSLARRFHYNKPLTIMDIPQMKAVALEIPDPETPIGAKGVGEPPVGAGYGAVLNAIADAIGVEAFRRAPVTSDVVLQSLTTGGVRIRRSRRTCSPGAARALYGRIDFGDIGGCVTSRRRERSSTSTSGSAHGTMTGGEHATDVAGGE